MASVKTYQLAALNITLNPHSAALYKRLFKDLKKPNQVARYRGPVFIGIHEEGEIKLDAKHTIVHGRLVKFQEFDPNAAWVNKETMDETDDSEMERVSIPDNLRPGMIRHDFAFVVEHHWMVFDHCVPRIKSGPSMMNPQYLKSALERIFDGPHYLERYNTIAVTAVPTKDAIKKIIEMPTLERLLIRVKEQNLDYLTPQFSEDFDAQMKAQNIRQEERMYTAKDKSGLNLNQENRKLAELGSLNGHVAGFGRDHNGKKLREDTRDHPQTTQYEVDESQDRSKLEVFLDAVANFVTKFAPRS